MKRWSTLILLFALTLPGITAAQQKMKLTASESVELALKNVTEIKNLKLDREIQAAKNREYIGQALPQVNGNIQLQRFFNIPVTLLPDFISPAVYQVLVENGVRNGNGSAITKPITQPQFFPAQFGVPWQSSAGFQFQQLLFQPDLFIALQARKKALEFSEANVRVMEDSIKSNVLRAYYSVLIAQKRKQFLDQSIARLGKLKKDQEILFKNGFAERLDIDKTQVTLNNLTSSSTQIAQLIEIGYAALKFSMAIDQKDTLELADTLSIDLVKKDLLEMGNFNYNDRKEIQLLNIAKELQGLDVKRNKLSFIPTLATYWSYSRNALRTSFSFLDFELPWYKTSVWGINMSIPIFDGGQKMQRIKQADLNLEKTNNTIENVQRAMDLQLKSSSILFKNALLNLDIQERNLLLAEKVYNTTKKKYEQGLGSSFELLQTEAEVEAAQSNYIQSLYDAVNARIAFTKALGKL